MVATVELSETNGAGPTGSTTDGITNLNFGVVDEANTDYASHPIPIPGNSMVKYIRLHWASGTANKINNIQIWKSNGDMLTGESFQTNLETSSYTAEGYATPVTTTYTHNAMPTSDPGAANLGIASSLSGELSAVGYSDYWKIQLQFDGTRNPGNSNTWTFTYQWDEQ